MTLKLTKAPICLNGQIVEFSGEYEEWVGKTHPRFEPVASSIEEVKAQVGEVSFPCQLVIKKDSSDYFGWVQYSYWCTEIGTPVNYDDDTVIVSSYRDIFESLKGLVDEPYYQYGNTETYCSLKGVIHDPFKGKKIGHIHFVYDFTDINFPPREVYEGNIDVDEVLSALRKAGHIAE